MLQTSLKGWLRSYSETARAEHYANKHYPIIHKVPMIEERPNRPVILILLAGITIALGVIIYMASSAKYDVLIKENNGSYYRAQALVVAGDALICRRDPGNFPTKKEAVESKETGRKLSYISMKQIETIQIMSPQEESGPSLQAWQPLLKDYVGDYTVNAAGNRGFMSLRAGGGGLYGTIRFPEWGRGTTEYLKNVRIVGGKIYFTRSATTPYEIKKLGTNKYFIQNYSGEYFRSGSYIRGTYSVQGEMKSWEAVKNK